MALALSLLIGDHIKKDAFSEITVDGQNNGEAVMVPAASPVPGAN